jgi:hypothetical protein
MDEAITNAAELRILDTADLHLIDVLLLFQGRHKLNRQYASSRITKKRDVVNAPFPIRKESEWYRQRCNLRRLSKTTRYYGH